MSVMPAAGTARLRARRVTLLLCSLAACAATIASLATAGPAAAQGRNPPTVKSNQSDQYPCVRPQVVKADHWVQYCPLWRGNVPVYSSPSQSASIVGRLVYGGSANWFVGDRYFPNSNYTLGLNTNHWWAYTLADNNRWGWVSEVYFRGGGNDVGDAGLYVCTFGLHYNAC